MQRALIYGYLAIWLLTFGYSANVPTRHCADHFLGARACDAVGGLLAGTLWPLYWTREGFAMLKQRSQ